MYEVKGIENANVAQDQSNPSLLNCHKNEQWNNKLKQTSTKYSLQSPIQVL